MRDVLFIYRVLLPPLILLINGWPCPSEELVGIDPAVNTDRHSINSEFKLRSNESGAKIITLNDSSSSNLLKMAVKSHKSKQENVKNAGQGWRQQTIRRRERFSLNSVPRKIVYPRKETFNLSDNNEKGLQEIVQESASLTSQYRQLLKSYDMHRSRRSTSDKLSQKIKLGPPKTVAPEYMIQLYHLLQGTHYHLLMNTVVTSFININHADPVPSSDNTEAPSTLVFNVTLDKEEEIIQYAEVRVFLIVTCSFTDQEVCKSSGQIQVYELDPWNETGPSALVTCKNFSIANGTWESINVTSSVQSWTTSGLKIFEVHLSLSEANKNKDKVRLAIGSIDGKEPLLVVFAKKTGSISHHVLAKRDTYYSTDSIELSLFHRNSTNETNYSRQYFQGFVNAVKTMQLAEHQISSAKAKQPSLLDNYEYVDSENIPNATFQSKIIRNNAQHKRPLDSSSISSFRKIYDTVLSAKNEESESENSSEESEDDVSPNPVFLARARRHAKARFRRHLDVLFEDGHVAKAHNRFKRSKKKRSSCRRQQLYIVFKEIKWNLTVIAPDGYHAFECIGKCYYPIGTHLSPTRHAIIQTLLHTSYPEKGSRACCVPTKLDPISILFDIDGVVKFDYSYEGMIAAECGCR